MLTARSCGAPIAASAHPHGVLDEDIRHALRNLIAVAADRHDDDVTLFLGPDRAVNCSRSGYWPPTTARRIADAFRRSVAADAELAQAVKAARADGYSWAAIAAMLGVSKQTAQACYGA